MSETKEMTVLDRFNAAMQHIPKGLVPEAPTEFKQQSVSINQVMREVSGVLRDHGLLVQARLDKVEAWPVRSTRWTDNETGEIVKADEKVILFTFLMNIADFSGEKLWDDERWVAVQRNINEDRRPEFWSAKALSYALKYWLCRRLGIDMGADMADDVDVEIKPPSTTKAEARREQLMANLKPGMDRARTAASKPVPTVEAKPAVEMSELSWEGMYHLWVASLGVVQADLHWAKRKKTQEKMTVTQAAAAKEMLAELVAKLEQAESDPFDTPDDENGEDDDGVDDNVKEVVDAAVKAEIGKAKAALAETSVPDVDMNIGGSQ